MTEVRRARLACAFVAWALSFAILTAAVPALAATEYRLAAGDVVELSIVGLPDLKQRAQVDVDGRVTLPLVGSVDATGLTPAKLRARVQDLIARKVLKRRTEEGRDIPTVIEPDEVTLTVAEYRPVYVNGDVSKPGEVPFRSDMTVRQAVALAGGYDVMRFRIQNPFIQAADLESDLKSLSAQYAQQQARIGRLEAELAGAKEAHPAVGKLQVAVSPELLGQIRDMEAEQFKGRATDFAKEKTYLASLVTLGESQLKVLNEQREREEEGAKADGADLERLTALFDRGNLAITRVTETRRIILLSATRLLQTNVQIERVRREREADLRKLAKLDDERRLEITRDLQDARVALAATRAKIEGTNEKLLYTATVRSQLVRGTGGRPEITVVRREEDGRRRSFAADEDAVLQPGDVVEVSLVGEYRPDQPGEKSRPERRPGG